VLISTQQEMMCGSPCRAWSSDEIAFWVWNEKGEAAAEAELLRDTVLPGVCPECVAAFVAARLVAR
jgi:hypothetical protein